MNRHTIIFQHICTNSLSLSLSLSHLPSDSRWSADTIATALNILVALSLIGIFQFWWKERVMFIRYPLFIHIHLSLREKVDRHVFMLSTLWFSCKVDWFSLSIHFFNSLSEVELCVDVLSNPHKS